MAFGIKIYHKMPKIVTSLTWQESMMIMMIVGFTGMIITIQEHGDMYRLRSMMNVLHRQTSWDLKDVSTNGSIENVKWMRTQVIHIETNVFYFDHINWTISVPEKVNL
jgi:hypothetical protein